MIITLMIFPLLYLLNVGSQFNTGVPPIGLCILRGFRLCRCTTAVLCFITDMNLGLRSMLANKARNKHVVTGLIALPAVVFEAVFFEAIMLVNGHRGVHFDTPHMFCESDPTGPQVKISAILTIISLALTLCIEAWTFIMLYRNWVAVRSIRRTRTDLQLAVLVRFGVFTLVVGFAAVLGAVLLPNDMRGGAVWNIFLVSGKWFFHNFRPMPRTQQTPLPAPFLAALAFGTRRDIMSVYAFWNWRKGYHAEPRDVKGQSTAV
ncbi:hypothetical protein DFH06DRAFT_1354443 [Mycena polygramma]|nr:hypothetical protein DFH06DRAFT_1354443 [Mycena polygramma]